MFCYVVLSYCLICNCGIQLSHFAILDSHNCVPWNIAVAIQVRISLCLLLYVHLTYVYVHNYCNTGKRYCLIFTHNARGCAVSKDEWENIRQCTSPYITPNMWHFRHSKYLPNHVHTYVHSCFLFIVETNAHCDNEILFDIFIVIVLMWDDIYIIETCAYKMWHYITHVILAMWMLNMWADICDTQYCHNELGNTLLSAYFTMYW